MDDFCIVFIGMELSLIVANKCDSFETWSGYNGSSGRMTKTTNSNGALAQWQDNHLLSHFDQFVFLLCHPPTKVLQSDNRWQQCRANQFRQAFRGNMWVKPWGTFLKGAHLKGRLIWSTTTGLAQPCNIGGKITLVHGCQMINSKAGLHVTLFKSRRLWKEKMQ